MKIKLNTAEASDVMLLCRKNSGPDKVVYDNGYLVFKDKKLYNSVRATIATGDYSQRAADIRATSLDEVQEEDLIKLKKQLEALGFVIPTK